MKDVRALTDRIPPLRDAAREAHFNGDAARGAALNAEADRLGGEAFWAALANLHNKEQKS